MKLFDLLLGVLFPSPPAKSDPDCCNVDGESILAFVVSKGFLEALDELRGSTLTREEVFKQAIVLLREAHREEKKGLALGIVDIAEGKNTILRTIRCTPEPGIKRENL